MYDLAAICMLLETVALLTMHALVMRRGRGTSGTAAGVMCGVALAVLPLRVTVGSQPPAEPLEMAVLSLLWTLATAGATAAGLYLRTLDKRRERAVADARRAQRLELARELHDLIGHDLSDILLEAQAAQLVPDKAMTALGRIEQAGLSALTSMDHTVRMLHDDPVARAPVRGIGDLPELVARYEQVSLRMASDLTVPDGVGAVAYRVVLESLTNARKHAGKCRVEIEIRQAPGAAVEVVVTDEGVRPARNRQGTGLGLIGLAERVEAIGGSFHAGPRQPRGWQVRATIPVRHAVPMP
ncbi:sensor histidine kinase [Nonomuraea sp. SYSU D8015]|uniref:sensor histidine kinase n=1 Tax=Nonomuraea sp. SYSU D8015 TaxID=2593644 RepID=UPI0016608161|nr:ATP-binding protein [Nonomuraea sp. SYSU D8015]